MTNCHILSLFVMDKGGHLSINEAAKILGVSGRTVRRYIRSGKLLCLDKAVSGGVVRILNDSLMPLVTGMTEGWTGMTNTMTGGMTNRDKSVQVGMTKSGQVVMDEEGGNDVLKLLYEIKESCSRKINFNFSSWMLSLVIILIVVIGSLLIHIQGLKEGSNLLDANLEPKIKYGRPPGLTKL